MLRRAEAGQVTHSRHGSEACRVTHSADGGFYGQVCINVSRPLLRRFDT